MSGYPECWIGAAAALFSQALAGEPQLAEALPQPLGEGSFGFAATFAGDLQGRFAMLLDGSLLDSPLLGEGVEQRAGWGELLREVADAACGELLAKTGKSCRVERLDEIPSDKVPSADQASRAFQLKAGDRAWTILIRDDLVRDELRAQPVAASPEPDAPATAPPVAPGAEKGLSPGIELLLDVELETSLRFGSREMPLGELLDLEPGDVVQLDRNVADPVDLIVGDKIVARGEVVLVNGNFGLRVTEVAEPKKRLESIRCLF